MTEVLVNIERRCFCRQMVAVGIMWAVGSTAALAQPAQPDRAPIPNESDRVEEPSPRRSFIAPPAPDEPEESTEGAGSRRISSLTTLDTAAVDLKSAMSLVGIQNPEFLAAQQRTLEAEAIHQLAACKFLPNLNFGGSFDNHQGVLQQSSGNILHVSRQAFFIGAGANAVAAGTVNVPGVMWEVNVVEGIYAQLAARQLVNERAWESTATRNEVELRVAWAYLDLLEANAQTRVAEASRKELAEISRVMAAFAKSGLGRPADAARAATELQDRDSELLTLEGESVIRSARLAELIGLDSAVRLTPTDAWAVPHSIVPEPMPLDQLIVVGLLRRPELQQRNAAIQGALLELEAAQKLPFSPTIFVGISGGLFGGGSDLAAAPTGSTTFGRSQARFGNAKGRADFDAMMYWTLRNLGKGNMAMIDGAASRMRQSQWEQVEVYDQIRAEIAIAFARVHARYAQLQTAESAVEASQLAWTEDLKRIRGAEGLPIEALDSQRLLYESRRRYLRTIIGYNKAQFALYQALGCPPADMLIRRTDDPSWREHVKPELLSGGAP